MDAGGMYGDSYDVITSGGTLAFAIIQAVSREKTSWIISDRAVPEAPYRNPAQRSSSVDCRVLIPKRYHDIVVFDEIVGL